MNNLLTIILWTLLPFLELRASIPYGILKLGMSWFVVYLIAVLSNIVLGIILYVVIDKVIHVATKISFIDRLYQQYIIRLQKKIHHFTEKYGKYSLALFIGIPLPMSGVYSGALAAYIIGLDYKKFIFSTIIGVLIAATIVTIITLSGQSVYSLFIKQI